jgi:hypothetical protein
LPLGGGDLVRESRDTLAKPSQHAVRDIGARSQPSRCLGESFPGERFQTLA